MGQKLHMVSFNIPDPPNYGGVISVFYHLKALHQLGAKITLHCFEYGRAQSKELEKYCVEVHYYPRNMSIWQQASPLPFIVKSRMQGDLYQRLLKDDFPILFEGTHVCGFLADPQLSNRLKIVRMHNIEWKYYKNLGTQEGNLLKKCYFYLEFIKLRLFEQKTVFKYANHLLAISPRETAYLSKFHNNVHYVAAFHANEKLSCLEGKGDYVIYHGDLSVWDNERAAIYLVNQVFAYIETPFIIAGLNPSSKLKSLVSQHNNVTLKANLSKEAMEKLIREAHINLLVTFNSAGMKLKLLNALYKGRFCLVNDGMVLETGMEKACYIENTAENIKTLVTRLMRQPFTQESIDKRAKILGTSFSNLNNAKTTLSLIEKQ